MSAAGLSGDGQADLLVYGGAGRAVYSYPAEHLPFWRDGLGLAELGPVRARRRRDPVPAPDGPAITCRSSNRAGVGGGACRTAAAARRRRGRLLTVAEAFRLYVSPTADDVPALLAAVDDSVLSPDLRRQFLRHLRRPQRPGGPAWEGFRAFTVIARKAETPDVVSLSLRPRDRGRLPSFQAASTWPWNCTTATAAPPALTDPRHDRHRETAGSHRPARAVHLQICSAPPTRCWWPTGSA